MSMQSLPPITDFYNNIQLSEEEIIAAIHEAKKKKYFKLQHGAYWQELEEKQIKNRHVTNI